MMSDIFSLFDPHSFNSMISMKLFIVLLSPLMVLTLSSNMWMTTNRLLATKIPALSIITNQLSRTYSLHMKGLMTIISTLFIMIIMVNLMGMMPYAFSTSSHLIFTLALGLPMWMTMILSSAIKEPKKTMAHFLPDGAPEWLNPFLVLTETTSTLVQPITLSFRLAANMTAGHIVLTLMSTYMAGTIFTSIKSFLILTLVNSGYIMFEFAICLIQAYIFCLLLSLYSDNHAH